MTLRVVPLLLALLVGAPDVAVTPRAMADLTSGWYATDRPGTHACLWGHREQQTVVIDSALTIFVAEPDSTMCRGFIGATGFYRDFVDISAEQTALDQLSKVLGQRPDWRIAGIVHGVTPVTGPNGTRIEAPLMWRAVR